MVLSLADGESAHGGDHASGVYGCGTALVTPFTRERRAGRNRRPAAGAPADRCRHSLSRAVRHDRRDADADRRRSGFASSNSSSPKRKAACPCSPVPAVTTRTRSSRPAQQMARAGADGILSVAPYYNKPTPEGLFQHYKAIAEAVPLPIIVYNVPGRTGVNVDVATIVRLSAVPNIVGVKEASGNMTQMCEICAAVPSRIPRAVGRRCADAAGDVGGRPRHRVGRLERGAGRDGEDGRARRGGRFRRRAAAASGTAAADADQLHRVEPDSRQGGDGDDGARSKKSTGCRSCLRDPPRATGSRTCCAISGLPTGPATVTRPKAAQASVSRLAPRSRLRRLDSSERSRVGNCCALRRRCVGRSRAGARRVRAAARGVVGRQRPRGGT